MNRIIGRYDGVEKGPLLICIGALHGNEPAGALALDLMFKMIEVEPITNPSFKYKGRMLGLIGNVQAFEKNVRYVEQDLNRIWKQDIVDYVMKADPESLHNEKKELRELLDVILNEIKEYQPDELMVLDLHTTSSFGGIFTLVDNSIEGVNIAKEFHAPVVLGMLDGLKGTTMHYFNDETMGLPTNVVTFESGQHNEDLSVNRAIAAVINCMVSIGSVKREDVENRHDSILLEFSQYLPKVAKLISHHRINGEDEFKMLPNFKNFQVVYKGQHLANDKNGPIYAQDNGLLLMPLYQPQGEDGFFIVEEINM